MISYTCCPYFKLLTFTWIVSAIQVVFYFVTVFVDYDSSSFLTPKGEVLVAFGAKHGPKMKYDAEVWRFVTPMFLHANLFHLLSNVVFQLILGFRLEPTIGVVRFIGVYVLCGIGGILFSSLVSPNSIGVGASTAIFGILGAMISQLAFNWNATVNNPNRNCVMIVLVAISIINILIGFISPNVDVAGHFGGLVTGLICGLAFATTVDPEPTSKEKMWRYIALAGTAMWIGFGILLFYTVVDVDED